MQQAPIWSPGAIVSLPLGELFTVAAEYERAGRVEDAERLLSHILAAHPQQPDTLHLGGIVAFRRKQYAEALGRMELAIRHGVDTPLYLRNICEIYRTLGRMDDALNAGRRAVALAPGDPLSLHNLSVIHYHRLELDDSLAAARKALALRPALPGAHLALAEALLLQGEMAEGWDEYEWRFSIASAVAPMPPTNKPQWDGAPIVDQTLLLVADQGFGDAIQFMRYIPWAAERCPRLAIAASPEVAPLLRQVAPSATVFQRWDDCPDWAVFSTLSGLPRLHGTRAGTIPWSGPYLRADAAQTKIWAHRLSALLPAGYARVGIVWAGRPTHSNDHNRSISLATLRELGAIGRTALISLQKGLAAAEAAQWFGRAPLISLGPEIKDYADTMAILQSLDLLITVDTSVAHLAGAMGCRTWLMLPFAPDWRWLLNREDTPWYPNHRLYRQISNRAWPELVTRITRDLAKYLKETTTPVRA